MRFGNFECSGCFVEMLRDCMSVFRLLYIILSNLKLVGSHFTKGTCIPAGTRHPGVVVFICHMMSSWFLKLY